MSPPIVGVFLGIIGVLAIVASLLPVVQKEAWWIRIFDFPRIQIAILTVLVLAADLVFRTAAGISVNAFRMLLAGCILYQAYMMYPYTFFARKAVQQAKNPRKESSFSLFLANVKMDNRNAAGLRRISSL